MTNDKHSNRVVTLWLGSIAALIFAMVIVGGATRLTDSGLSITEWRPLLGAIPPLNELDWQVAFNKYQQIPEFKIQNRWMSLADFKFIYWWEWAHRFLGRLIGVAFIVPMLYFIATKRLHKSLWRRLALLFVLGGAQGALGWYMVSSGLETRVDVSQYRLAAHLTLAVALFAAVLWTAMTMDTEIKPVAVKGRRMALGFVGLFFLQVAASGFVAGLDAGHASYTWPLMEGAVLPAGLGSIEPWWRNLFENALTTQFNHRLLAYVLFVMALIQFIRLRSNTALLVFAGVCCQLLLGILTILNQVPLNLALAHQGGALVVLALALWHAKSLMRVPVPNRQ